MHEKAQQWADLTDKILSNEILFEHAVEAFTEKRRDNLSVLITELHAQLSHIYR